MSLYEMFQSKNANYVLQLVMGELLYELLRNQLL